MIHSGATKISSWHPSLSNSGDAVTICTSWHPSLSNSGSPVTICTWNEVNKSISYDFFFYELIKFDLTYVHWI